MRKGFIRFICLSVLCCSAVSYAHSQSGPALVKKVAKEYGIGEVKDFVRAAGKCDFDIDVCYNRAVIDAKSLLGMLYLGLSKDLTVKYGGQNTGFENTVQKYAVC